MHVRSKNYIYGLFPSFSWVYTMRIIDSQTIKNDRDINEKLNKCSCFNHSIIS